MNEVLVRLHLIKAENKGTSLVPPSRLAAAWDTVAAVIPAIRASYVCLLDKTCPCSAEGLSVAARQVLVGVADPVLIKQAAATPGSFIHSGLLIHGPKHLSLKRMHRSLRRQPGSP